jgi:hypothetical protein
MLFHSPHAGQRPIHFGLSFPHALQNHTILVFAAAIIMNYFLQQSVAVLSHGLQQAFCWQSAFFSQHSFLSHSAFLSQHSFFSQHVFLSQSAHFALSHSAFFSQHAFFSHADFV